MITMMYFGSLLAKVAPKYHPLVLCGRELRGFGNSVTYRKKKSTMSYMNKMLQ